MSAAEPIVAPSDAQLAYIAGLCREQGWTPPEAVYSKREASEIIGQLKASTYRAEDYAVPGSEQFEEMQYADEWPDRIAPNLADLEDRP